MLLTVLFAAAASLDNLETAGLWGSPLTTGGAAVTWNPAAMAAGRGTRFVLEGAPTFATITWERAEPNGGLDTLKLGGAVPYGGLVSDVGVDGLGVGVALSVPYVRGGTSTAEAGLDLSDGVSNAGEGVGRYALRDGMVQSIAVGVGLAYQFADRVAVGGTVSAVRSSWTAVVDTETLPDLDAAIRAEGEDPGYTDADLERPEYSSALAFGQLSDTGITFTLGLHAQPVDQLAIGVAYTHGLRVENEGEVDISFGCPPTEDEIGRFGVEDLGLCYADVHADARIGYTLPARVQGGVRWTPSDRVTLDLMGGVVFWSVFEDYDIAVSGAQVETEDAAELVNQTKPWARANHDSGWGALDGKVQVVDRLLLGGRVAYDRAAVPDEALLLNNYDANDLAVGALLSVKVVEPLQLAASYTHHFLATRTITDSAFGVTLGEDRNEARWYYPHGNGVYAGGIDRIGVSLVGSFE